MILYTAADLLWATRLKAAAEDCGIRARPVRTVSMLHDRLGDEQPEMLLVDLDAAEAIAIVAAGAGARDTAGRPARVIAFGPHEDRATLEAARAAGADRVMTRGALHARLGEVLRHVGA